MNPGKLKTAVKVILPLWLAVKIAAALISYLSLGAADLTFFNPSLEQAFRSLVFIKDTSAGFAVFIAMLAIQLFGTALAFFTIPDSRTKNIIGFISYAVITLMDIISAAILIAGDGIFILSLILSILILLCLLLYGRELLSDVRKPAESADFSQGEAEAEPAENNP